MDSNVKDGCNYLDGVPVKINKKFWPLKPVTIPTAFDTNYSTDLLAEQYDFSLERSVIQHTQNRLAELKESEAKPEKSLSPSNEEEKVPNTTESNPPNSSHCMLPWQSNIILQPSPQQSSTKSSSIITTNNMKINLSDFENDSSSPFDLMELRTINDLEELNSVFQVIHTRTEDSSITDNEASNVAKSVSYPLSLESSEKNPCSYSENSTHANRTTKGTAVLEDDVSIRCPLHFESSSGKIPSSLSENFISNIKLSSLSNFGCEGNGATCLDYVPSFTLLSQVPSVWPSAGSQGGRSPCQRASMRGSKSYSDISSLPDSEVLNSEKERSRTPPISDKELSHPPPFFNQEVTKTIEQEPLPMNEDHFGRPLTESSNGYLSCDNSAYQELDEASRTFVDCIVEMGFIKGQVARAVKHLGIDEKKVVEHLCQIQALEESGYESMEAEAALHLHDYNREQAKEFLDLVIQFQDLGFEKDAVKKALVQNKNDWNKTIDALLPN